MGRLYPTNPDGNAEALIINVRLIATKSSVHVRVQLYTKLFVRKYESTFESTFVLSYESMILSYESMILSYFRTKYFRTFVLCTVGLQRCTRTRTCSHF